MHSSYRSFYVLESGDTVSGVFMKVHGMSAREVAKLLPAIAANNPHIADLNRVRPGDVVDVELSTHDPALSPTKRSDMEELARIFESLTPDQQRIVCEQPHVAKVILDLLPDVAQNGADAAAYTLGRLVQEYADASKAYGLALAQNYAANARGTLSTELHNMVTLRKPVQDAAGRIPQFVQSLLLEEARRVPSPMRFRQGQVLGDVRRLLRLSPSAAAGYQPFSRALGRFASVVKYAGHVGTAASVVIPTTVAAVKSYHAHGTPEFGHVTAEGVGNVLGGLGGSALGYFACSLVFSAPSAGTSLFWCGLVVGGTTGIALSKVSEAAAGATYDYVTDAPSAEEPCRVPALP